MKSWKWKILFPVVVLTLVIATKFVLWDFPISSGKRVGNLTKISKKGKVWPLKTWEGTIDEGSGDKLTTQFSVSDDALGEELYAYEGKQVVIYYKQYFLGWPRDTNYDVISWKQKDSALHVEVDDDGSEMLASNPLLDQVSKTLFCSFLGTLYKDQDLYQQVKNFIQENNLYIYNQIEKCND